MTGKVDRRLIAALLVFLVVAVVAWALVVRKPTFSEWLADSGQATQVSAYEAFLEQEGVGHVMAMPSLLSVARDASKCGVDPWVVPPTAAWRNVIPTLRLIQALDGRGILRPVEVTSVYRGEQLNDCAGGAKGSKHRNNSAIDMQLLGNDRESRSEALCEFWRTEGHHYALGLGFYGSYRIHLDTQGYRTWGRDYRAGTSPCVAAPR